MSPLAINCCSTSTETGLVSTLGNAWGVPIVSNHASSPTLDDNSLHPALTLLYPTDSGDSKAVVAWFSQLGVTHFACVYVRDEFGKAFYSAVQAEAILAKVNVSPVPYNQVTTQEDIRFMVNKLAKTNVRYVFLVSFGSATSVILKEASRAGISGDAGYFWLLQEISNDFVLNKDDDADLIRAMRGVGRIERQLPENPKLYQFMADFQFNLELQQEAIDWMSHDVDPTFFREDFVFSSNAPLVSSYTAFSYDAFMTIALGACSIEKDFPNQEEMIEAIQSLDFEGVTGRVHFDPANGGRVGFQKYSIFNVIQESETDSRVAFAEQLSIVVDVGTTIGTPEITVVNPFVFADGTTQAPHPLPPVTENLNLITVTSLWIGLSFMALVMIVAIVMLAYTYKNRKLGVVRMAQPEFLFLLGIGTFIMASSIIPMSLQEPVPGLDIACMASVWLFSIGFVASFSSLFCRMWRLNRLVGSSLAYRRVTVKAQDVLYPFVILMGLNIIVLTTWSVIDPLRWTRTPTNDNSIDKFGRTVDSIAACSSQNKTNQIIFYSLYLVINLCAVAFAIYQSYLARNIRTDLNESFYVALAMATMGEAALIGIPVLIMLRNSPSAYFCARSVVICVICMSFLLPTFVPKVILQGKSRREPVRRLANSISNDAWGPQNTFASSQVNARRHSVA